MKAAAVVLALLASVMPISLVAAEEFPEGSQGRLVLERNGSGPREVVTVLRQLPPPEFRSRFPVLLRVKWGYQSLPTGMPTEAEIVRGRELYSKLDAILGPNGVWAMSRTGDGGRTMYYYVKTASSYQVALTSYFDSLPPISVKIKATPEPEWSSVREVLSGVR